MYLNIDGRGLPEILYLYLSQPPGHAAADRFAHSKAMTGKYHTNFRSISTNQVKSTKKTVFPLLYVVRQLIDTRADMHRNGTCRIILRDTRETTCSVSLDGAANSQSP